MQNAINPLISLAEERQALIERSHAAAAQLELEPAFDVEEILARYRKDEDHASQ